MFSNRSFLPLLAAAITAHCAVESSAQTPKAPSLTRSSIVSGQQRLAWTPYPATQEYRMMRSASVLGPFTNDASGSFSANVWLAPRNGPVSFYRLQAVPISTNSLLLANVLNRLAYGPTPDEIERVTAIGANAFIAEQLAPEAIQESLEIDTVSTDYGSGWQYFTTNGNGTSGARLLVYLNSPGDLYLDEIKLVLGTVPEAGTNIIRNGDFESPLSSSDFVMASTYSGRSAISTEVKHSGNSSLHVVGIASGTVNAAITQTLSPALVATNKYTLSYWFYPGTNAISSPTVQLSGTTISNTPYPLTLHTKLESNAATMEELRAWHVQHAVRSKRQLLEVMLQFLDNHFVTQYTKSNDYFGFYGENNIQGRTATNLEYRELERWRQALLNPACTFKDLLRISAESSAMIIYLDTVNSRGDGRNVANENYARELLELFTFGVDNGYDQNDIVETSKTFTGWTVALAAAGNESNPLGPRLANPVSSATNFTGLWAFTYNSTRHNTNSKSIFPLKTVPARFGSPYAGRSYQLSIPIRTGTNSLQDAYDVVNHLADQPFTQEFLSVKLCRLFVHDDFNLGYDFTDPNLSEEGKLVRQCMLAWENANPKGQIRPVLATIFNSDLFRGNGGSLQKVKTPLEYTVSAVRALRSAKPDGTYTAETDGILSSPMQRMGNMNLFDRFEPDGYPETAPGWISTGTLSERIRWMQAFLIQSTQNGHSDVGNSVTVSDPVALITNKLAATSRTNAPAVADYFLGILYPGEGKANLDAYRSSAITFLNSGDDGVTTSAFNTLSTTGNPSPYDTRVRGMVGMLMTLQRFHEQ